MTTNSLGYIVNGAVYSNLEVLNVADTKTRVVNVKDYGAVGDGVTDDYLSIIQAFSALPTDGGVLYFPAGTYMIETQLIFSGKNFFIQGAGQEVSILTRPNTGLIRLIEWRNMTGGGVRDMCFHGNITYTPSPPGSPPSTHLLKTLTTVSNMIFDNIHVKDTFVASLLFWEASSDMSVTNSLFENADNGVLASDCVRPKISHCRADTILGDPGYAFQFKNNCTYGIQTGNFARNCVSAVVLANPNNTGSGHNISNCSGSACSITFQLNADNSVATGLLSDSPNLSALRSQQCSGMHVELASYGVDDADDHIRVTDVDNSYFQLTGFDESNSFGIQLIKSLEDPVGNRFVIDRYEAHTGVREPFLATGSPDLTQNLFIYAIDGTATFTNDAGGAPTSVVVTHNLGVAPRIAQIHITFSDDPQDDWWVSAVASNTFTVTRASSNNTAAAFSWQIT